MNVKQQLITLIKALGAPSVGLGLAGMKTPFVWSVAYGLPTTERQLLSPANDYLPLPSSVASLLHLPMHTTTIRIR